MRDRAAKVASLIAEAERLEAEGTEEAIAKQDQVMAQLRNLAIFAWRGMPASLLQRKKERVEIYNRLQEEL
jgi:hypothetical protein